MADDTHAGPFVITYEEVQRLMPNWLNAQCLTMELVSHSSRQAYLSLASMPGCPCGQILGTFYRPARTHAMKTARQDNMQYHDNVST